MWRGEKGRRRKRGKGRKGEENRERERGGGREGEGERIRKFYQELLERKRREPHVAKNSCFLADHFSIVR